MRPDQERVKNLLTDTVTLLCKNGLQYNKELKVQGLLGITLDNDDVFVVHINEIFEGLVGGQLMGITAETSAVAAADSATQPAEVPPTKSRKATPHRHDTSRNSSPLQGSMKRKAFNRVQVKREVDDDLQVLNTKEDNFIPGATDLSGDGDREAMRMSYGGLEGPPTKKLAGDSGNTSDTYSEEQATGGPFIAGIAHSLKENDSSNNTDTIGLDDSRGSGQPVFQDAAGCSDWDPTQGTADNTGDNQANDSVAPLRVVAPSLSMKLPTMVPTPTYDYLQPSRRPRDSFKPFVCPDPGCNRRFYHQGDVYRHQRINHGAGHIGRPHLKKHRPRAAGKQDKNMNTSYSLNQNELYDQYDDGNFSDENEPIDFSETI